MSSSNQEASQLPNKSLITAHELVSHLNQNNLVILDASMPPVGGGQRPEKRWPEFSLPNAKRMDINKDFSVVDAKYPHTMLTVDKFEQACQEIGIDNNSHVVLYDDLGMFSSARGWWMLKAMGLSKVSVLDGGLPYWLKSDLPTVKAPEKLMTSIGGFSAQYQPSMFCSSEQVLVALENPEVKVLDARAKNRFLGEAPEPREGVRSGHMPNAKNLPYADLFEHGLMKSPQQLTSIFNNIATLEQSLIFSCGSGITACILALAADVGGYSKLSVYDGSWAQWGAMHHLPVTTLSE